MGSVCEILIAEGTKNAGKAKCKMFNYCHNVFFESSDCSRRLKYSLGIW